VSSKLHSSNGCRMYPLRERGLRRSCRRHSFPGKGSLSEERNHEVRHDDGLFGEPY